LTFRDLKKKVSLEIAQQSSLFERLQNKPFWIWNIEGNKQEDIITNRDCCFNHIIGLKKIVLINPLYDYERMIFDSLVPNYGNSNSSTKKHLWIKKATGLGISKFMLRLILKLSTAVEAFKPFPNILIIQS
jgi:hypothetical protein